MGKSKGSTVQTTAPDAQTSDYMRQMWGAAQKAATGPTYGVDPMVTQAAGTYAGAANAGGVGFRALSGDQGAFAQLSNPFQANVLDATQSQFDNVRARTMNSVNDAATQAGAFGGSRHGVAEGVAMSGVARDENSQLADIRQRGYDDTMNRASGLASMGMAGAGGLAGLGQYSRDVAMSNDPNQRMLDAYSKVFGSMPHGSSTTTTQTGGDNWANGLLGLGVTGLGLASGLGWAPFATKAAASVAH